MKLKKTKRKHLSVIALYTETSSLFSNGDFISSFLSNSHALSSRNSQKIATSIIYSLLSGNVSSHYEMALPNYPLVLDFDIGKTVDKSILNKSNSYVKASILLSLEEYSDARAEFELKVRDEVTTLLVGSRFEKIKAVIFASLLLLTDDNDRSNALKLLKKHLNLPLPI